MPAAAATLCTYAFSLSLAAPVSRERWAQLTESTNAPWTVSEYLKIEFLKVILSTR